MKYKNVCSSLNFSEHDVWVHQLNDQILPEARTGAAVLELSSASCVVNGDVHCQTPIYG